MKTHRIISLSVWGLLIAGCSFTWNLKQEKKPTVLFCVAKSAARLVDESCLPDGYNIHKTLFVIAKSHARWCIKAGDRWMLDCLGMEQTVTAGWRPPAFSVWHVRPQLSLELDLQFCLKRADSSQATTCLIWETQKESPCLKD